MSRHPSFGKGSKIKFKKNVLKRYDRIEQLKKEGKWKAGNSVYGLPKTKPVE
jgi:small basic protein (TIGR04137 family)